MNMHGGGLVAYVPNRGPYRASIGYYYNLQNNTGERYRISGNLNGTQTNDNYIFYESSGYLSYWNNKQWPTSAYDANGYPGINRIIFI